MKGAERYMMHFYSVFFTIFFNAELNLRKILKCEICLLVPFSPNLIGCGVGCHKLKANVGEQ